MRVLSHRSQKSRLVSGPFGVLGGPLPAPTAGPHCTLAVSAAIHRGPRERDVRRAERGAWM